jgi:hypothetical protein
MDLPETDAEIREMPYAAREEIARIWLSQAATEARVAKSFALVHESFVTLGADAGRVRVSARAALDEHRHESLCRTMAERYVDAPVVATPALPFAPPAHAEAKNDRERRALWIVGQCAFNETFASAYLALCYERAEIPLVRAAIRQLLADEIDHARIGWAFLTTLDREERAVISDWLVPLAVCNLREWRKVRLAEDERLARHGIPPASEVEAALVHALDDLIVPGLAHVGLNVQGLSYALSSRV